MFGTGCFPSTDRLSDTVEFDANRLGALGVLGAWTNEPALFGLFGLFGLLASDRTRTVRTPT